MMLRTHRLVAPRRRAGMGVARAMGEAPESCGATRGGVTMASRGSWATAGARLTGW
jgi:hypothetical protein